VAPVATGEPAKLLAALGGAANLATVAARSSRLLVTVHDDSKVDQDDLGHAAPRGAVRSAAKNWQIITGGDAERLARALQPQAG
jgi:PTS system N-acetylglucosamine-specific IIC component